MPDPENRLAILMERVKPGSVRQTQEETEWTPPAFERYEDIRTWLKESVLTATMYERYPDGRWTMELLLKEQVPGRVRILVL